MKKVHEPSAEQLMNEAKEWVQCARSVSEFLADLIHDADSVECKQVALSLEAITGMTRQGLRRMGEAHAAFHRQIAAIPRA
ncbi:hypothetical protein FIV34_06600 [Luteibacter pinisoli]|uniref:Uncharacterized protein n=1 Tax=Luteibacter pinisoli TaxID=2589080 RepID=A0A4Y5Z117_9GAMM|nr:hypothetical protein [Luteibacter pinisoli]QDE38891.1 hypothetical protein FIV34_06600 [Luteibacter pinisoli]